MQIEVKLPDMTGDDTEIVLDEYTVSEGDTVNEGDPIALVTAGKASDLEVPSPKSGTIAKLTAEVGEPVQVGAVLAMVEAAADDTPDEEEPEPAEESAPEPASETASEPEPEPEPEPAPAAEAPQAESSPEPEPAPAPAASSAPESAPERQPAPARKPSPAATSSAPAATRTSTDASRLPAGPEIRRFAREVGVELTQVRGTGPNGRILRDDVLEVVRASNNGVNDTAETGATERDEFGPVHIEKLSGVRRTIAQQMHKSWTTVPRVTNFDDADVTELERMRQSSKADYAAKNIKLTTMPFLIKAIAMSLREHPAVNASIDMENRQVIYKDYINIGIAVDTQNGLVVPSLTDADQKSISEIAWELSDLAERVRNNNFNGVPLKGSTFTISNLGAIGGTYSTPIVNVPEVAILLVGRSRKLPIVVDDEVVVRLVMPLSLSYDHRLVDGGAAAYFLNEVKGYLEAPSRLLLAP